MVHLTGSDRCDALALLVENSFMYQRLLPKEILYYN
jgi:hypothetical protein